MLSKEDVNGFNNTETNSSNVLLRLDVNIDDTNQIKIFEIFVDQDYREAVNNFCEKNNIIETKKDRLLKIVEEKLNIGSV